MYILHEYNIFPVLIFFCIRRYQRENLEFSADYLYKLYNVLQAGCTFILLAVFQIISGWKITRVKFKKAKGNRESYRRCNRATVVIAIVVIASEHSISFLCGNNIAVSYSSGISSSVRYQVAF